jgi:lipoate-protein ligase A
MTSTNIKELSNEFSKWFVEVTMDDFHDQMECFLNQKFEDKIESGEMSDEEFRKVEEHLNEATKDCVLSIN